ncbi:hypothetical protein KQJ29_35850, partial [Enterococcus sp. S181_ASV_20]|nr:hypothetical protein [Enterococcus sp. S181_ASV_20]
RQRQMCIRDRPNSYEGRIFAIHLQGVSWQILQRFGGHTGSISGYSKLLSSPAVRLRGGSTSRYFKYSIEFLETARYQRLPMYVK